MATVRRSRQFDTLDFSLDLYRKNQPQMAFAARSLGAARAWQRRLRRKLVQLLGGFPQPVPLRPRVVERKRFEGYTRETVLFQSRENLTAFAYFLLPDGFQAPGPAVVCFPGHGRGVDDIVGIKEDGTMRSEWGEYQADFALQCVHHGYATLAVEQVGFGHRRDERARKNGPGASSCQPASGAALLLGQTMIGWRVYDGMRAVDYLQTRSEVDPKRIAAMGISGGGTTTFHLACVETRVKVAVVSGYFNTFRDSILSMSHCMDNYVPGVLRYAEMYDLAGLIAPRYLFAESGTRDSIFPVKATRLACRKAKQIFDVFGAADHIALEVFPGEHSFWGRGAFKRLKRWL